MRVRKTSRGELVFVEGEAGFGKTVLLRRFTDRTGAVRVLWGACDALITPRPLGPFLDIAVAVGGVLEQLLESDATPHRVARALMRELSVAGPTVLVLLVTEALAAGAAEIPPTIRDAVLARCARLSVGARTLLDGVSVVPSAVEVWLLDALVETSCLAECLAHGMLTSVPAGVAFRHEFARLVVEDSVPPNRKSNCIDAPWRRSRSR